MNNINIYHLKCLFLLLVSVVANSMATAQAPIEVKYVDTAGYEFILDKSVYVFTKTGEPEAVKNIVNWQPIKEKRFINLGTPRARMWMKFTLQNSDSSAHQFMFCVASHVIKSMELFHDEKGNLQSLGITGTDYPFYSRPYPFPLFVYPLTVEPQKKITYYLAIDPKGISIQFSLILFSKNEIQHQQMKLYLLFGSFIGILLLVGLFNIFLYFILKDKIHLLYFLYSLSVIWVLLAFEALDFQFFYPNHPSWYLSSRVSSIYVSISMALFIMQVFLQQNATNSRFYKTVNVLKWVCLFLPVADIYFTTNHTKPLIGFIYYPSYRLFQVFTVAIVLLSCIEKIIQGYKLAIFYLVAISVFLAGVLISVLNNAGYLNFLPVPPTVAEAGMVIEAIIISFGILYRYNFFKREKELLAKELAAQQLSIGKQIISTQENERKRIAEDLHDELGSSLAALKLHLQKSSLQGSELAAVLQVIDKASADTRHISHDLMPPEFEKTSLFDVLQNYYSRLNTESGIQFHFIVSGNRQPVSKEDELVIYRVMMELTGNILRHSGANEATVQMLYYEKTLELMVEDNGKGFEKNTGDGIGLKNIQSRVNYLQGEMQIDSNSNGTTIIIQLPLKHK